MFATVWQLVWHCLTMYIKLQDNIVYQYCLQLFDNLSDTDWQCISNCKIILCINNVLQLINNLSDTVWQLVWHCLTTCLTLFDNLSDTVCNYWQCISICKIILCINNVLQLINNLSDTVWHWLTMYINLQDNIMCQ